MAPGGIDQSWGCLALFTVFLAH